MTDADTTGCLGPAYNPTPPRVWSRVQTPCVYPQVGYDTAPAAVWVPISVYDQAGQPIEMTAGEYDQYYQPMVAKGNVLQYKANSANLTKQQRYSKIARGQWTNRTKTWATQSQKYTNPNTGSLLRVGGTTVPAPAGYISPWAGYGCTVMPSTVPDGGTLSGTTTVNPCSGALISKTTTPICNLSTDCDVPGTPTLLCWNDKVATWYPRQRLTMPSSGGGKFPVNYKFLRSANGIVPANRGGVGSY